MTEADLLKRLMLAISNTGARIFRNHVGLAWQGDETRIQRSGMYPVQAGDVIIRNARPVRAGLCNGSSDLVGWTPTVIDADHVGRTVAIFTSVEAKSQRGQLSDEQRNFLDQVRAAGGIAIEARDVDETLAQINEQRRGKS